MQRRWGCKIVTHCDHGDQLVRLRFGSLIQECRYMCDLAARSKLSFHTIREAIQSMTKDLQDKLLVEGGSQSTPLDGKNRVLDPLVTRTKGRPPASTPSTVKRKKRCTICRVEGHTRVTCPLKRLHTAYELNTEADSSMGTGQGPQMSQEVPTTGDDCFLEALMVSYFLHPLPIELILCVACLFLHLTNL